MDILLRQHSNRFLIFALIFALLNMGAIFSIFGFQKYGDTTSFVDAINWVQGQSSAVDPWIVLRPLGMSLAVPFEFLGEGAGLIVQNIVFYFLCTFLIFKIVELIYNSKKLAFYASVFFVTATSVIEVGLAYLTDMGAWFFYLLSIFLTLLYFKNHNEKLIPLTGFLAGIGFLMKENGALGILFFGLMVLFSKAFSNKEKIVKLLRFGIFFLIPFVILQIFMYQKFGVTSFHWYLYQLGGFSHGEGLIMNLIRYFGQLFRTLGILWIFFFIGLWREWRQRNWDNLKIFLAMLPASLSFFLWPISGGGRVVFIFAPLGIILASYGCKKIRPLAMAMIILLLLALNYTFCWFNPTVSFANIVAEFFGIL